MDHIYHDPHFKGLPFYLQCGGLTDSINLIRIIQETHPDEIYYLAVQNHVQVSFESPQYTADIYALGTLKMLGAIRILGLGIKTKFYHASTSELYGKIQEATQNESTYFIRVYPMLLDNEKLFLGNLNAVRDWDMPETMLNECILCCNKKNQKLLY